MGPLSRLRVAEIGGAMRVAPWSAFRKECTMVKQILKSFESDVSQMTCNGSTGRSACLENISCELKLEHVLCEGRACGKGCPSGSKIQDYRERKRYIPCGVHSTGRSALLQELIGGLLRALLPSFPESNMHCCYRFQIRQMLVSDGIKFCICSFNYVVA